MNRNLLVASLIAISPLVADECCTPLFDSCICEEGPETARFTVRSRQPGGIGYPTGYTSFDLFYAPGTRGNFTPFVDLRGHLFNDGKPAFNTGLGVRYLPECNDIVYGINAYWDYRQAKHATFNQVGLGLEALWTHWDLHLNGYAPVSRHKKSYRTGFLKFQGNNALFYKKYELAMWGGDLALGYQFYSCDWFDLHATLDGYYFQGDYGKHAGGGFLRLRSDVCNYLTVEGQVSYDSLFKWNGQGELAINFPFGKTVKRYPRKTSCCQEIIALEKHLVEKPDRFEIMPTSSHKKRGRALDPTTGQPLKFISVDNTSHSAGTFESPYPTLAQAVAVSNIGDVIYIFPGNGTSSGLTTSTILKDRQSLVGSGAPFEVATRFGNLVIPQMSSSMPQIVTSGDSVTIANGNRISGLSIFSTAGNCITSGTAIASNLQVARCAINSPNGLSFFANVAGDVKIHDNAVQAGSFQVITIQNSFATVSISRNKIISDSTQLLCNSTAQSKMDLTIESNTFSTVGAVSAPRLFCQAAGSSRMNATIQNNSVAFTDISGIALSVQTRDTAFGSFDVEGNRTFAPTIPSIGISISTRVGSNSTLVARLAKNQSTAPTGGIIVGSSNFPGDAYSIFSTAGSKMTIESPNGQLSGVQNSNSGHMTQTGAVQFIPLQ